MCIITSCSVAGGHPSNEDAFDVVRHPDWHSCWIGALADGQGGQSGGGEAARLACRAVIEMVSSHPVGSIAIASTWLNALRLADERVRKDQSAGYTTLIGFAVFDGHVIGAANGDSALWLAGADGHILDLTASQAKNPPIGSGGAAPTPFAAKLPASWIVLAMSDGVWKGVGRERVAEVLRQTRGQALLDALLAEARLPWSGGLGDDFTAVALEDQ
jgi:serine/threonine protein phosphatase PrpC